MKRGRFHLGAVMASAIVLSAGIEFLPAQGAQYYPGKNFMAPEYYPASNGIRRLKNVIAGSEYHFMTNGTIWLLNPRLTNFAQDGKVEWTVVSPECTYNINTREVYGNTNMTFRTADEILFLSGVGFLWQQSNAMLILSNQSYTWIDKRALTTNASRYK